MKTFFLPFLVLAVCCCFASCEDDDYYMVDWAPVSVYIEVHDAAGNDLLDPDSPSRLIDSLTLTYAGVTWPVNCDLLMSHITDDSPDTKFYLAVMQGLQLRDKSWYDETASGFMLEFGEISGSEDLDEDMVLTWPDRHIDVIHYHCSDHVEGRHPHCKRVWKLNGAKHDSCLFTFVR